MSSPTSRSLEWLRLNGWSACVIEKWLPHCRQRKDAFGFGDILACRVGETGATLVQTTSQSNVSARIHKIRGIAEAGIWLASGNRIVVHGWAKRGPKGKRKTWQLSQTNVCEQQH